MSQNKPTKLIGRLNSIVRTPREQLIEQINKTDAIKIELMSLRDKSENIDSYNTLYERSLPQVRQTVGLENREGTIFVKAFVAFKGNFDEIAKSFGLSDAKVLNDLAIVEIPLDSIMELVELPNIRYIEMANFLQPTTTLPEIMLATGIDRIKNSYDGSGVLVGIIDDDIDCFHPLFMDGNQTRITYYKNSSGIERTNVEIDAALTSGTLFPRGSYNDHGTKVAAIAVGNQGIAHGSDIGFISHDPVSPTTTDAGEAAWDFASRTGGPCVIISSLGDPIGSHDGKSSLETWLESMQREHRVSVVFSAGNEHGRNRHIQGTVAAGNRHILSMNPAGSTSQTIEIWYPGSGDLTVELQADGHQLTDSNRNPLGALAQNVTQSGEWNGDNYTINHYLSPTNGDYYINIQISSGLGIGTSRLEIIMTDNGSGIDVQIDGWSDGRSWDPPVGADTRDLITTTLPGTGRQTITVGSHLTDPPRLIENNSGRGTRDGRDKPEILTYSDIEIEGLQPGSLLFGGTSASTPVVGGVIALLLQCKGGPMFQPHIRACLQVKSDPSDFPALPVHGYGWGRLDASSLCRYSCIERLLVWIFTRYERRL